MSSCSDGALQEPQDGDRRRVEQSRLLPVSRGKIVEFCEFFDSAAGMCGHEAGVNMAAIVRAPEDAHPRGGNEEGCRLR